MNIYQVVLKLNWGDAIGNEVLAMDKLIKQMGYNTKIFSDSSNISNVKTWPIKYLNTGISDIIVYHTSIGTYIDDIFINLKCRKIMVYHNMTPECFFEGYSQKYVKMLKLGRNNLKRIKDSCDMILADSEYNKQDLIIMGYNSEIIKVMPIIIDFDTYNSGHDEFIIDKFSNEYVNILFAGRIAPNKKHEDLLKIFCCYKNDYNDKSRLILTGSFNGMEKYYAKLRGLEKELKLRDVLFTGHIPLKQLLAYYKVADVFLCMSEHEGFCVPLLEAMTFEIPIIAFNSSAIPYTLGESGLLVDTKNYYSISKILNEVTTNKKLNCEIIQRQKKNLELFTYKNTSTMFMDYLNNFINGSYC